MLIEKASSAEETGREQLVDLFARTISYFRLSLTDHCNLRCIYCMPKGYRSKLESAELLTYEELLRVVGLAVKMGVRKVRLTGGEPLVRRDVISFIKRLNAIAGLNDIRLTTNGILLAEYGSDLRDAGVRKLNISLDSLRRDRYRQITGRGDLDRVLAGIELVKRLGFETIKLNMVVLKGVNDDELLDFARLSLSEPYQVRFIEFMPIGISTSWEMDRYLPTAEIMERLKELGPLHPVGRNDAGEAPGPARVFKVAGAVGSLGFISPISHHFCESCNRLRLTAEGKLRSCLLSDLQTDIKSLLRSGGSDKEIQEALLETIHAKPKGHNLRELQKKNAGFLTSCHVGMSRIGG